MSVTSAICLFGCLVENSFSFIETAGLEILPLSFTLFTFIESAYQDHCYCKNCIIKHALPDLCLLCLSQLLIEGIRKDMFGIHGVDWH